MELLKEFDSLYQKINSGKPYNIYELSNMIAMKHLLENLKVPNIKDYTISKKYYDELNCFQYVSAKMNNRICDENFYSLNKEFLHIIKNDLVDYLLLEYEPIKSQVDMLKDVKQFYKNFGEGEYKVINRIINKGNVHIERLPEFNNAGNGFICSAYGEDHVFINCESDSKLVGANIDTVLVHELGHPIGKKPLIIEADVEIDPFRETIPMTLEMVYSKTRSDNDVEYAKHRHEALSDLIYYGVNVNNEDALIINKSYQYTLGIYIGLYLSRLYIADKQKFDSIYKRIKKNIYTRDELKIFDLLLRQPEFITGDFLKREIEETQKQIRLK